MIILLGFDLSCCKFNIKIDFVGLWWFYDLSFSLYHLHSIFCCGVFINKSVYWSSIVYARAFEHFNRKLFASLCPWAFVPLLIPIGCHRIIHIYIMHQIFISFFFFCETTNVFFFSFVQDNFIGIKQKYQVDLLYIDFDHFWMWIITVRLILIRTVPWICKSDGTGTEWF